MTTLDPIEARLTAAFAIDLSSSDVGRLDERIGRALARPAPSRRFGMPAPRWFLRPLPLLAALALLTGSVIGASSLLDRLVQSSGTPGWLTAWERAELLDLEQTDGDVTINLVRAYADRNQVLVGFTVTGLPAAPDASAGDRAPIEWTAGIVDPSGRSAEAWATVRSGSEADAAQVSASIHTWEGDVTPEAGTWVLTFTSVGYDGGAWTPGACDVDSTDPACLVPPVNAMVEGTWRFAFDLPAPTGAVLTPAVAATADAATITLTELHVSATMVRARLALRIDGQDVDAWAWTEQPSTIRHGDTSLTFNTGYRVTQAAADRGPLGDESEWLTPGGAGEVAGIWEITIPEIWYSVTGEDDATGTLLAGPWTLTVDVP